MDINAIRTAISTRANDSWVAAETPMWSRRPTIAPGSSKNFGLRSGPSAQALAGASDSGLDDLAAQAPPPSIDWRTHRDGRVTSVKDQGDCGSCVAFAVCATLESAHWIQSDRELDLSEGHLFHCGGATCDGWDFDPALERARLQGVGLETDLPYEILGSCVEIVPAVRITTYRVLATHLGRKRAIAQGPVVGAIAVYEDLTAYQSGVYRHVLGTDAEYHAICIVGYDDADGCWIAKNSWGVGFGADGFFKIAYGECEIEAFPFYAVEVAAA